MTSSGNTSVPESKKTSMVSSTALPNGAIASSEEKLPEAEGKSSRPQRFIDLISGNDQKQFITGSVIVPLLITIITITVGARIASNYQDWQDRRARTRDILDGTREATTDLLTAIEILAQKGGAVERIRSKQTVLEEIRSVDEALAQLKGRSSTLAEDPEAAATSDRQKELEANIRQCRQVVDVYVDCLSTALTSFRTEGGQPCTDKFRNDIAEKGSCKSIETTTFSITY